MTKNALFQDDGESTSSDSSPKPQKSKKVLTDRNTTDSNQLIINQKFARQFEERERNKELRRAKDVLANLPLDGDEGNEEEEEEIDSESAESEDDDAKLLSAELDVKIMKTINMLKKKDPKIYDRSTRWFSGRESSSEEEDEEDEEDRGGVASAKKKTYKDILREQLLKDGADVADEENDNDFETCERKMDLSKQQLLYDQEQREIRRAFFEAEGEKSGKWEQEDDEEEYFTVKQKTKEQIEQEELELQREIEEMERLEEQEQKRSVADKTGNKRVSSVSSSTVVVENDDSFLLNYLKKKMWKDPFAKSSSNRPEGNDDPEEDLEEIEAVELFEHKYNFRFEELQEEKEKLGTTSKSEEDQLLLQAVSHGVSNDGMQVVGHSRQIANSIRRTDDKRKQQRDERRERKEKEKRQKLEELKRLKNLKRQELQSRLMKIGEIGGLKQLGIIDENVLDEEWDPERHEQLMQQQFGDDYYQDDDEDFKQSYSKVAEEEDPTVDPVNAELILSEEYPEEGLAEYQEAQYNNQLENLSEEEIAATRTEVQSLVDELYALDYEDMIAGMPCRFKYRNVEPEDFGLSTEDILLAEDNELNQYVSLKHIASYASKRWDVNEEKVIKKRRKLRKSLKEKMKGLEERELEQLKAEVKQKERREKANASIETAAESAASDAGGEKHKRKRRKRKQDSVQDIGGEEEVDETHNEASEEANMIIEQELLDAPSPSKNQSERLPQSEEWKKKKNRFRKHKKTKKEVEMDPLKKRLNLFK